MHDRLRIAWIGFFESGALRTDEARMCDALERIGADVTRVDTPWEGLDGFASDKSIDWLIFSKCRELAGRRLRRVSDASRPHLAQVLFDLMDYEERLIPRLPWPMVSRTRWWVPMARQFDVVFLKERGNFERYADLGINCIYLDQGADLPEVRGDPQATPQHDLAFIGRRTPRREQMLRLFSESLRVAIHTSTPKEWDVPKAVVTPAVFGTAFSAAVADATVVWGESVRHDIDGYWSDRPFKVMANSGCYLTRFTPGVDEIFTNHRDIAWYNDDQEALALATLLAGNPEVARQIGQNARKTVEEHHTYDHRARQLMTHLVSI
jgi:hypothetical protein